MPVILRIQGYRVWFYMADLSEPPHVHIGKAGREAKFWMDPVSLARAGNFRQHELNDIESILVSYQDYILQAWQQEQDKRDSS